MNLFFNISLLLFPGFAFSNNEDNDYGSIRGFVSTADGHAAVYVSVLIKNTGKGSITDDNGNFEFKKIKSGSYILHFSLSEYIDSSITVEVKQNETVFLRVQLRETFAELKKNNCRSKFSKICRDQNIRITAPELTSY